jgi:hypothetical protein
MSRPYFASTSFWNTPLPASPPLHPDHDRFLRLSRESIDAPGLHINLHEWTVPIYRISSDTLRIPVARRMEEDPQSRAFLANSKPYLHPAHRLGLHPDFAPGVPLPPWAQPDPQEDAHVAVVDEDSGLAWDMWGARRSPDGSWKTCTGMAYSLDGSGVFDPADFPVRNGESIHPYGPSRATGVPAIAGLIRHEDVLAGRIAHKLLFAARCSGLLAHYFPPTIWTDGGVPGGPPAGSVIQLDPDLDLGALDISDGAKVVARALQEFGAVLVDYAEGFTLGGEGLWNDPAGRTWAGLLEEDALFALGFDHFRYLAPEPLGQQLVEKGMVPFPHRLIAAEYRKATGLLQDGLGPG